MIGQDVAADLAEPGVERGLAVIVELPDRVADVCCTMSRRVRRGRHAQAEPVEPESSGKEVLKARSSPPGWRATAVDVNEVRHVQLRRSRPEILLREGLFHDSVSWKAK
jgi:hypothetical protein